MTELEQQLTSALTALSKQYEAEMGQQPGGSANCSSKCSGSKKRSRT